MFRILKKIYFDFNSVFVSISSYLKGLLSHTHSTKFSFWLDFVFCDAFLWLSPVTGVRVVALSLSLSPIARSRNPQPMTQVFYGQCSPLKIYSPAVSFSLSLSLSLSLFIKKNFLTLASPISIITKRTIEFAMVVLLKPENLIPFFVLLLHCVCEFFYKKKHLT